MKKTFLFSLLLVMTAPFLALAAASDDESAVQLEKKTWQTYKDRQAGAFKALCTPDYVGVYDTGMKDMQTELADMNDVEIRGVTFSDMRVTHPTKDMATVTYKADVQGAYKGHDFSGPYNCSAVWLDKGGTWLCVLHTEVKAATP